MSKHAGKPVDMSVPPDQRRRRRQGRIVVTPPAQMGHATNPKAARQRRRGEKWLAVQEQLRLQDTPAGNSDTGDFTGYTASADEAGRERDNVVVISRQASQ